MENENINMALMAENTSLKEEISDLKQQVNWLMEQLQLSKRRQFGVSSEQSDWEQTSFFNEAEATADTTAPEPELETVKEHRRKKRTAADRIPPDLPLEIVEHELPEQDRACPECGHNMHVMGHDERDELKLIPAKAVIVRHVRSVYACRCCEKRNDHVPIEKASMPEPVIKGSFASPEAVAHIAVQKFVMASPLYRQEQEWERNGILLSRQTMSNWLVKAAQQWLQPIYDELHRRLCERDVAHADETTLQVLKEDGKPAQSKSYMWLYRTSGDAKHPIVLYDYQQNRNYEHPQEFLRDFKGYLHADGYDGYHNLPKTITVVGCWAHLRRKFDETLKTLPEKNRKGTKAWTGLEFCNKLFHIEKQLESLSSEKRKTEREKRSKRVIADFYAWISATTVLPKSLLGQAVHYAVSQRKYLENYLLDGRLEISNNRAERSIKPFVIGRKNWLFSNTPNGAKASAVFYSLIETAKENGINPYTYLTHVFRTAPNLPEGKGIEELLPFK
jgi:transposase